MLVLAVLLVLLRLRVDGHIRRVLVGQLLVSVRLVVLVLVALSAPWCLWLLLLECVESSMERWDALRCRRVPGTRRLLRWLFPVLLGLLSPILLNRLLVGFL